MRLLVLITMALLLSGCPFGLVTQINRIPKSQGLREPQLFNHSGVLTHEFSGFAFPEWYANFQRVTAYRYDTPGVTVSIGYNDRRPTCLIVATFYVYPALKMTFIGAAPSAVNSLQRNWLRDEFARSKAEVEAAHPNLQELSVQLSFAPVNEMLVRGPSFYFVESDHFSELRLFLYNRQWFVKYRFTYPETCWREANARLRALTHDLPWVAAQDPSGPPLSTGNDVP